MKRGVVSFVAAAGILSGVTSVRAADVDAQDVLILKQTVENQTEAIDLLKRRMAALESRMAEVQRESESLKRANGALTRDLVTQDQLRALATKVEQVDSNRAGDSKRIFETLKKFAETPLPPPAPTLERRPSRSTADSGDVDGPKADGRGSKAPKGEPKGEPKTPKPAVDLPAESYQHVVKPNETLSEILSAYRKEFGLKTSMAQLEAANPGLNAKKLRVDQKINIPIVK